MRLRAYDTVHVSSVKAENLRPGEEFEVSDAAGDDLLKAHPGLFAVVSRDSEAKAEPAADNKAADDPENKAESAPENKTTAAPTAATRQRVPRR